MVHGRAADEHKSHLSRPPDPFRRTAQNFALFSLSCFIFALVEFMLLANGRIAHDLPGQRNAPAHTRPWFEERDSEFLAAL